MRLYISNSSEESSNAEISVMAYLRFLFFCHSTFEPIILITRVTESRQSRCRTSAPSRSAKLRWGRFGDEGGILSFLLHRAFPDGQAVTIFCSLRLRCMARSCGQEMLLHGNIFVGFFLKCSRTFLGISIFLRLEGIRK